MNSTSTDTLGGRIGSELKRSGISMRELARRIDIAQPSISKWCSNQAVPRVIYLERMAKVFGVSAHWLTYGEHASGRDEVVIRPRPESSETIGLSLTADSAKRTFGTEANKLSLFTQESDDMAPTIRSGSLVVINHTINKVIGSGVYLVQVGETKELRRIQPLVDGTLDIRIDNPKRFANEIATDDQDRHSRQGALHGFREAHPLSSDQNKGLPSGGPFSLSPIRSPSSAGPMRT